MKNIRLTKEEKEIIKADEQGLLKSSPNISKLKNKYAKIAKNTLRKNRSITIRLADKDLQKIKAKAMEEGLPYQTYITSIIHKNVY